MASVKAGPPGLKSWASLCNSLNYSDHLYSTGPQKLGLEWAEGVVDFPSCPSKNSPCSIPNGGHPVSALSSPDAQVQHMLEPQTALRVRTFFLSLT